MQGLTTATLWYATLLASTGGGYQEAYNRAEEAGKPLLVLVGTEESPSCREMKLETMPELGQQGGLENIVYTAVESKDNPDLTRQLLRSDTLPQLVLYTPVGKLWRRTHISGSQSQGEILAFLKREIARGKEVAERRRSGRSIGASESWSNVIYSYSPGGS